MNLSFYLDIFLCYTALHKLKAEMFCLYLVILGNLCLISVQSQELKTLYEIKFRETVQLYFTSMVQRMSRMVGPCTVSYYWIWPPLKKIITPLHLRLAQLCRPIGLCKGYKMTLHNQQRTCKGLNAPQTAPQTKSIMCTSVVCTNSNDPLCTLIAQNRPWSFQ